MRRTVLRGAVVSALILASAQAMAAVNIHIDLTGQKMHVSDGAVQYNWPISSAGAGYQTPTGLFHPTRMSVTHFSNEYQMAPMPYSIFFKDGYAIHGTTLTSLLGRPASHGCVHLSVAHAALLYKLVARDGAAIEITGRPPISEGQPSLTQAKEDWQDAPRASGEPPAVYQEAAPPTEGYGWRAPGYYSADQQGYWDGGN